MRLNKRRHFPDSQFTQNPSGGFSGDFCLISSGKYVGSVIITIRLSPGQRSLHRSPAAVGQLGQQVELWRGVVEQGAATSLALSPVLQNGNVVNIA